ncbi:hypothetical protein Hanom_Chr06g00490101 [Helianthus anomalus]
MIQDNKMEPVQSFSCDRDHNAILEWFSSRPYVKLKDNSDFSNVSNMVTVSKLPSISYKSANLW